MQHGQHRTPEPLTTADSARSPPPPPRLATTASSAPATTATREPLVLVLLADVADVQRGEPGARHTFGTSEIKAFGAMFPRPLRA